MKKPSLFEKKNLEIKIKDGRLVQNLLKSKRKSRQNIKQGGNIGESFLPKNSSNIGTLGDMGT
jgi:hypothetical protein